MSQNNAPSREVAQRAFATEINAATHTFRESDDDRAPVYGLLPTGAKANRVFVVGTLTETQDVGSDDEYWQGRIVDPTATVFVYAGQYQPEAASMLREIETPAFVAIVGKPRTFETDDGDTNVSLRPEHLITVTEGTRHRWVTETAQRTLDRIEHFDETTNEYAQLARNQYGDDIGPYRQAVITALESLPEPADTTSNTHTEDSSSGSPTTDTSEETDSVTREGETQTQPDDDLGEFSPDEFTTGDE